MGLGWQAGSHRQGCALGSWTSQAGAGEDSGQGSLAGVAGSASAAGGPEEGRPWASPGLEGLVIISDKAPGSGAGDVNASRGLPTPSPT